VIVYSQNTPIGAVWSRLFIGKDKTRDDIDDKTPEMAIAVLPSDTIKDVGTTLLHASLALAKTTFPAVGLDVRADNPNRPRDHMIC